MEESSEKWDAYDEESSEDEELDTSLIDKILPDGADSEEDSRSDGGIDDTEGGNEHDLGDEGGVHIRGCLKPQRRYYHMKNAHFWSGPEELECVPKWPN
ncbi:hypothetical protein L1887_08690 [Cichorium endivia]|nr:hypothetical protein L1887_08690 [Cichorium endivia]